MIPHTKAFKTLKQEVQQIFDFALVVSYAVPSLKYALKKFDPAIPPPFRPDFFDSRPVKTEKVLHDAKEYKALLSRYIVLSSFSFFEAYFHNVLKEIVEFHGGSKLLMVVSIDKNVSIPENLIKKQKRKLQEYPTKSNIDSYKINKVRLIENGYLMPTTLLSHYGFKKLLELANGKYIPASKIPDLLDEVLQLRLNKATEINRFKGYCGIRNKIAHGRATTKDLNLSAAIKMNDFLRNTALKIDRHILDHYLLADSPL